MSIGTYGYTVSHEMETNIYIYIPKKILDSIFLLNSMILYAKSIKVDIVFFFLHIVNADTK